MTSRGPNYPAISFPEALKLAEQIYLEAKRHKTDKDRLAKIIGYKGLSGRSQRVLGALNAFDLIEGTGNNAGLTVDAESIIVDPPSSPERYQAILRCAFAPRVFNDIRALYRNDLPGDQLLSGYLLKYGYSHDAIDKLIETIKETYDYVAKNTYVSSPNQDYNTDEDSLRVNEDDENEMNQERSAEPSPKIKPNLTPPMAANERELFSYEFEPRGSIRLLVSSEVDTQEALDILEDLVKMKQKELARKKKLDAEGSNNAPENNNRESP